jgi:lipopolysaccharide export LptBFGC system permease protein LptF
MARNTNSMRPRRNTAPMWKKLATVLSVPVALVLAITLLHIDKWNAYLFIATVIVIAVAVVWGMSRLLGVHLSLGSWD